MNNANKAIKLILLLALVVGVYQILDSRLAPEQVIKNVKVDAVERVCHNEKNCDTVLISSVGTFSFSPDFLISLDADTSLRNIAIAKDNKQVDLVVRGKEYNFLNIPIFPKYYKTIMKVQSSSLN